AYRVLRSFPTRRSSDLQADVVAGTVLLDEVGFQDEGLDLGAGDDVVDVRDVGRHHADFGRQAGGRLEVAAHAVSQGNRLADVDHLAGGVLHEVDAWPVRQEPQLLPQLLPDLVVLLVSPLPVPFGGGGLAGRLLVAGPVHFSFSSAAVRARRTAIYQGRSPGSL